MWREVEATADRHGVLPEPGALHDVFEGRRSQLAAMTDGAPLESYPALGLAFWNEFADISRAVLRKAHGAS